MPSLRGFWRALALVSILLGGGAAHPRSDPGQVAKRALLELEAATPSTQIVGRLPGQNFGSNRVIETSEWSSRAASVVAAIESLEESERELEATLASVRLDLVSGRETAAIDALRALSQRSGPNKEIDNALAASLLTRGHREKNPIDLLMALRILERVTTLHPDSLEPTYNRALALSALHLRSQAAQAWDHVLELETKGAWADLARRQRSAIWRFGPNEAKAKSPEFSPEKISDDASARQAALSSPFEARRQGLKLLRDAMGNWSAGETELAESQWGTARFLGEALDHELGDRLLKDHVDLWSQLLENNHAAEYSSLIRRFAEAETAGGEDRLNLAESIYREVRPSFEAFASPFALESRLRAEIAHFYGSAEEASSALEALLTDTPKHYPSLRGRVLWMSGIVASSRNRFTEADHFYRESHRLLLRVSGKARAANLHMLRADNFDRRGEVDRSWRIRLEALEILEYQSDVQRRYGGLIESAQTLRRRREPALALLFLDEAARLGHTKPHARIEIRLERARNLLQLGHPGRAKDELEKAKILLASMEPNHFRRRLQGIHHLASGLLLMERLPQKALALFDQAAQKFRHSDFQLHELSILQASARVHSLLGVTQSAERKLRAAVSHLEVVRRDAEEHRSAFDSSRYADEVFSKLIVNALKTDASGAEAFRWLEQSRGWTLGEHWQRAYSAPEIATLLAPGTAALSFMAEADRVYCFVFESGSWRLSELDVTPEALRSQVSSLLLLLESAAPEKPIWDTASALSSNLLGPLKVDWEDTNRLIVVPDKSFRNLPLALLQDPARGQLLLENVAASYAPSLSIAVEAAERLDSQTHPSSLLITVAGDGKEGPYGWLPPLEWSQADAAEIAKYFPDPRILEGPEATVGGVLSALRDGHSDVFHFVGHGLASETRWEENALLLTADESHPSGYLGLSEVLEHAASLRLVTLASCDTLRGYELGRGGSFGLGRAFLAAGTPSVVGALWSVDHRPSTVFMQAFYRHLTATENVAEALRRAKLESFTKERGRARPSWTWAAFELIGG